MQTTRTSFAFPAQFYNRLVAISKQRNLSLAQTVQALVEPALASEEEKVRQRVYSAFESMRGISKAPIADASETIDEVLYGAQAEGK